MRQVSWVVQDDGTYNMVNSVEAYYQSHGKLVPCDEGCFASYGIISPEGDFYACGCADHAHAAFVICKQLGYINTEEFFDDDEYRMKDLLYNLGWCYVNTCGHEWEQFYHKWDEEEIPQKMLDTMFDWKKWIENGGE